MNLETKQQGKMTTMNKTKEMKEITKDKIIKVAKEYLNGKKKFTS